MALNSRDQITYQNGVPGSQKAYVKAELTESFHASYPGAFSAADIYATLQVPGNRTKVLGNLAAVSISTHRDAFPVTAMPYVSPRGFTQGHRVVAGTLMFHTLDRNAFGYPEEYGPNKYSLAFKGEQHPDEFFLFDILISYVNDIGMAAYEQIIGIRLLDFGKTLSLENLHPIESYSYMALDYQPMRPVVSGDRGERSFVLNRVAPREPVTVRDSTGRATGTYDKRLHDRAKT